VHFIKAKSSSLIVPSCSSIDIQIDQRENSSAFELGEGWLLRRGADGLWRRICWLPYERRHYGTILACSGQQVVIGAEGGLLTILDLSNV
jgi:hypothetical protein